MQNEITENGFYTSLEEAKKEIWRRRNNSDLREKVAKFIGNVPSPFQEAPKAALGRNVATPNFEYFHFLQLAKNASLAPLVTEYISDKFVTLNDDKLGLGKMPFYKGRDKKGRVLFEYKNIIDCTGYQGKAIAQIKTLWGEHLVDFHHRLLQLDNGEIALLDATSLFKSNNGHVDGYYHNFLALFICHAVLFENFITNEEEERFSRNVVFPAFKQVVDYFGLKPLIVPLVPHDTASDIYWRCYPAELEDEVLRCLSKCKAKDSSGHRHAGRCNSDYNGSKRDKK